MGKQTAYRRKLFTKKRTQPNRNPQRLCPHCGKPIPRNATRCPICREVVY